jgi:soluble P-type ATPase
VTKGQTPLYGSSHVDKLKLVQALYTGGNIATAIGNGTNDATSLLHKLSKEMNVCGDERK